MCHGVVSQRINKMWIGLGYNGSRVILMLTLTHDYVDHNALIILTTLLLGLYYTVNVW